MVPAPHVRGTDLSTIVSNRITSAPWVPLRVSPHEAQLGGDNGQGAGVVWEPGWQRAVQGGWKAGHLRFLGGSRAQSPEPCTPGERQLPELLPT